MFRTDKVQNGYMNTYLGMAARIGPHGSVCELGVDVGGSLEMWQHLFPNGLIVGVDHSAGARWPEGTIKVVAKQEDPNLAGILSAILLTHLEETEGIGWFDLIVDDASHDGKLTRESLVNLWPLVAPGGWYVIEDWGVGFPSWTTTDDSMLVLAQDLVRSFDPEAPPLPDVRSIYIRGGLFIIRKKES